MSQEKHFLTWRARLILLPSVLAICMFFGMQVVQASPVHADSWSFVRIVHASPDAGIVDVFMDGKKTLSNFQFGTITGYVPLAAGTHTVQVAVIGTGAQAAVLTQAISVNAGTAYTVAALGTKATGLSLQVFADNNLVSGNKAKVRVYHLSPGAGSVDVENGRNMLISGLTYAKASDYVSVPAGSYTFSLVITQQNVTLQVPAQLKAWTVTSIFAVGTLNNGVTKLQFVDTQVNGMPGMPGTGSDPHALTAASTSLSSLDLPLLLGCLILLTVAFTVKPVYRLAQLPGPTLRQGHSGRTGKR